MKSLYADEAPAGMSGRDDSEAALGRLRDASRAYYGEGDSPVDDATYDRLRLAVPAWEQAHPAEVAPDSPTGLVGDGAAPAGDVAHSTRLLGLDNGRNMKEPREPRPGAEGPLAGRTVVVTGRMSGPLEALGRSEMNALIERAGGKAGSGVNSRTAYLVCAPSPSGKPSSKAVKAEEPGVTVLTPEAFAELVADHLG
ncbi:BRCT domain-containing protein [Streptomyces lavendulae]|uniref:BRCT domain-containing protein n=1 Tax=Streptomyces lavendulae TaxID=1914 RepID=UPI0033FA55C6